MKQESYAHISAHSNRTMIKTNDENCLRKKERKKWWLLRQHLTGHDYFYYFIAFCWLSRVTMAIDSLKLWISVTPQPFDKITHKVAKQTLDFF